MQKWTDIHGVDRAYGVIAMYEDLKNEKIIIEIRSLVDDIENVKDEIDAYVEFMKEMFLFTSGKN